MRSSAPSLFAGLLAGVLCLAAAVPTRAEIAQEGNLRVNVGGSLAPKKLPRRGEAPVSVSISGQISTTDGSDPPQLQAITIALNRQGHLTPRGIPYCRMGRIDPSTTAEAIAACRSSQVGAGSFSASVKLPQQSPFPAEGRVVAFNGRYRGRPAVLAHIFGTEPAPTSYVLPFTIERARKGTYGAILSASLPRVTSDWGFVTGISMKLDRRFEYHGQEHSYLAAGCPAPAGRLAVFSLARTSFAFDGGTTLTSTLTRTCRVRD